MGDLDVFVRPVGLAESSDPLPPKKSDLWTRVVRTMAAVATAIGLLIGIAWAGAAWERQRSFEGLQPTQYQGYLENVQVTREAREFSIGVAFLDHPGEAIEILNVSALTSSNLDYSGAFTVWPRQVRPPASFGPGYLVRGHKTRHPISEVVPARETSWVTRPSDALRSVMVMATFRLRAGDLAAINGLMMTYRVAGRTTTEVINSAAIVCLSPRLAADLLAGECQAPADAPDHWEDHVLHQFGLLPEENIGDGYNSTDY